MNAANAAGLPRARGRLLALLLCLLLTLSACGGGQTAPPEGPVVTDAAGRVLPVPEAGGKTAIASVYAVAVPFLKALGLTDQVVAINCKSSFWTDHDASLGAAGTVGRGVVDLEALGIPVLCIRAEDMDGVYATLTLLGRYFGCETRAQEVIESLRARLALTESLAAQIPGDRRLSALTMGGELGRVAGGDMLQSFLIETAGGLSAAAGTTNNGNWLNVGAEQVFAWDPDVIFLTSSTPLDYTVDELLNDPAWSAVSAVKNGRVYQIPARIDSWDMPGVAPPLCALWMLSRMYPDVCDAETLQREIDAHYEFLLGRTFSADELGYLPEGGA